MVETIDFAQNEVIQHGVVPLAPAPAGAAQKYVLILLCCL